MAYRDLIDNLKAKQTFLNGTVQEKPNCLALQEILPEALVPDWLLDILCDYRLCGCEFELPEEYDQSGLGASIGWLTPEGMISEAIDCQPGISVYKSGFLPFGSDLTGSGDPYFLDMRDKSQDPTVVRIPHDYATEEKYPLEKIEQVCSLSQLIGGSQV